MSLSATLAQYAGRSVDLSVVNNIRPPGSTKQETPWGLTNDICTGAVKMAQRVLLTLLTERGSIRVAPELGTGLPGAIRAGRITTSEDVEIEVGSALVEALSQLAQNTGMEDERIVDLDLESYALVRDRLDLSIRIQWAAARPVILPVSIPLGR